MENKEVKKHACPLEKQAEKSRKLKERWQNYTAEEKQARLNPLYAYWEKIPRSEHAKARLAYWDKLSGEEREEFCKARAEKKRATIKAKQEANRPHEPLILPW